MIRTKMFKGQLFILVVIYIHNSTWAINAAYDTGKELWKLFSMLDEIELNTGNVGDLNDLLSSGKNQEIKNQMHKIHRKLGQMEKSLDSKRIGDWIKLPLSEIMLYKCMDTFTLFIQNIDQCYEKFYQYMTNISYHFDDPSRDPIHKIIGDAETNIAVVQKIIIDAKEFLPHDKNLAFAITGYSSTMQTHICGGSRIIPDALVQLFTIVVIAEIKVNMMLTFRNRYQFTTNGAYGIINSFMREQFAKHFGNYVKIFQLNVELAESVHVRACDPEGGIWIRDESFYELAGTLQTTIFRYHWARCKYNSCNDIRSNHADLCEAALYDRRSGCTATVSGCAYLGAVQACVLKSGPHKFQYVNSTSLGFLGRNAPCPENDGYVIKDGSGWDFVHAACVCNCDEHRNKISLNIMESRTRSNKVIVGVRFLRRNEILYIQPRDGTLGANGRIRRYSERWITIPSKTATSTIDKENRVFFLDDLRLPPGYILTGIKFNKVTRGNVTGFAIEIFGVPFDYESGQLNSEAHPRISRQVSAKEPGRELSFDPVSSINTPLPHTPSSSDMKYVSLKRSGLKDDFGQSTLPLFDAVRVSTDLPSALGGIGIFHKGVEGYAGFISLRGYGVTYTKYFTDFQSAYMADDKKANFMYYLVPYSLDLRLKAERTIMFVNERGKCFFHLDHHYKRFGFSFSLSHSVAVHNWYLNVTKDNFLISEDGKFDFIISSSLLMSA